jgi:hypothetical protein
MQDGADIRDYKNMEITAMLFRSELQGSTKYVNYTMTMPNLASAGLVTSFLVFSLLLIS